MGLRELLILILILAIVAVILRGLYVALKARRGQLRMQLEKNIPQYDTEELLMSELPNGGARLVERSFAKVVKQNSELSARDRVRYGKGKGESAIPVLMDTVEDDEEEQEDDESVSAPRQSSVASAREAARQKHLHGQSFKPVHRPIDRLAAQAASGTSASLSNPEEPKDDYEDFFEDPLDASPLSVDPLVQDAPQDDEPEYFDERDDDEDYEDEEYDDEEFDDEPYDDDEADQDDEVDEAYEAQDDFDNAYEDEDEDEPDDLDDSDDDDDQDDVAEDSWQDDEEPESWEDENDADDEEMDYEDIAEEFDDVYGESEGNEEQDSYQDKDPDELLDGYDERDVDWDDEPEQQEAPVSAPRRWLQWAGKKFSGMGAAHEEPVRERDFHGNDRAEPVIGLDPVEEEIRPAATRAPRAPEPEQEEKRPERSRQTNTRAPLDRSRQATLFDDEEPAADQVPDEEPLQAYAAPLAENNTPAPAARQERSRTDSAAKESAAQEYSEVLVINVMAKPDREFAGIDLLPALLGQGLRFGDMNIFHRHVDSQAGSPVLFSVANMLNPGTFDLNQINDFATRGVCFFMTLPNVANSMQAFDRMLDAAQQLRMTLDGDLKDDVRSVMTAQTIEHYRQRVRDFDLRQLRQHK